MKHTFSFSPLRVAVMCCIALTIAAGCGKKSEDMTPVQPGETITFRDMVYKFSFKAPKSWVAESQPGKQTSYFSTQGAETRFQKQTEGDYGAMIEVGTEEHKTKEKAAEEFKQNFEGVSFANNENTTLGGQPAIKVAFTQQGSDEDAYTGYRIFADQDSVMTYFEAATFGQKRMQKYQPVFDLAEKSVTLGYVLKAGAKLHSTSEARMMEDMKPSDNFSSYNGSGYTIGYPDNFSNIRANGANVFIRGDRQDATIQVDVFDSKGSDLAKFAENNAKTSYHGASVGSTTIGGQPAKVINYSLVASAGSRAYFLMNGSKVYRITINWPTSLEAAYKPSLEKAAASFKFK